jgi:uncharacterized protein YoxC
MDVISIFTILLLLSASGLCIALILYLNRITSSIKQMQSDIQDLSSEIKPFIASTTKLSEKLSLLSDQAREPIETVKEIVTDVRDRVDNILELEEKLRGGFEGSVSGLIKNLSALANGVSTFWNTFRKNNG